jgi:RND family efflux transporter MFP subunit
MNRHIIFLIFIITIVFGCNKNEKEMQKLGSEKISVELFKVKKQPIEDYYEVSAVIVSKNPITIVSKAMGTIVFADVNEGDKVNKGKLLLRIDSPEIKAMLDRAQASIEESKKMLVIAKANEKLAENTFKRYENLFKEQAISKQEFENKETNYLVAKSEVERLENIIKQAEAEKERIKGLESHLYVYAPVGGVITKKFVNLGTNVLPGTQLLILEPEDELRVEANVDEKVLGFIKKGMKIPVYIEAIKKEFVGILSEFIPAVDAQSRTFKIKIDLPKDKNLVIGLYSTIKIKMGTKEAMLIPKSAIYTRGQLSYVYVVGEGRKIAMRLVKTGKEDKDMIEILSGLNDGEEIVKNITLKVKEGIEVQ